MRLILPYSNTCSHYVCTSETPQRIPIKFVVEDEHSRFWFGFGHFLYFFFFWVVRKSYSSLATSVWRLVDHTFRHARTPWMSNQPDAKAAIYTTYDKYKGPNIYAPIWIPASDPSNQAAADLRHRQCGHWNRHLNNRNPICKWKSGLNSR